MNPLHLDKLKELSIFTTSDAAKLGITRAALGRAVKKGHLERLQRGLYGYVGREESEMQSLLRLEPERKMALSASYLLLDTIISLLKLLFRCGYALKKAIGHQTLNTQAFESFAVARLMISGLYPRGLTEFLC
ncbi:type IV toxin-antitoxin system AbiEi family antitoxin domain-containing protein [Vibrio campbellii]|uniref:type IV toxin-antitoxin system AbiEi family antitoxin domain-containing protein n=1 Tax=Vibrio campbellii TaxID=680 RepID=UPI001E409D5D|nr:type IV toxin-antitoxin system AbiEi family antitoxin domain-containing protein [Vibrio campbellii]